MDDDNDDDDDDNYDHYDNDDDDYAISQKEASGQSREISMRATITMMKMMMTVLLMMTMMTKIEKYVHL